MKAIMNVVALSAVIALCACNNSNKTSANMGAVGDSKSGCCAEGKSAGGCCSDKSKSTTDTNMGAVSDQKASGGCCSAHKATSSN